MHFGAFTPDAISTSDPKPVAVISFFLKSLPLQFQSYAPLGPTAVFRKFATDTEMQGRGIGSQLFVQACEEVNRIWGVSYIWCDARVASKEWYAKRGLGEIGTERFFKAHIPYLRMGMAVAAANLEAGS